MVSRSIAPQHHASWLENQEGMPALSEAQRHVRPNALLFSFLCSMWLVYLCSGPECL